MLSYIPVVVILFYFQVLNVQGNKLKALPATIGNLASLQSLILQGMTFIFIKTSHESLLVLCSHLLICYFLSLFPANDLRSLPPEIGNLRSLRTLNISENNNLPGVPPTLAHIRTLEVRKALCNVDCLQPLLISRTQKNVRETTSKASNEL